jgi:cell wall-associated NlpC family hydrolase
MSRVMNQARTYIGTPWKHRGRKRSGLDCAGLVWRVYADLGLLLPDIKLYGREPHRDGLMTAVREAFGAPVPGSMQPGDVLVMTSGVLGATEPHHMGIVGDGGTTMHDLSLIHADGSYGVSRVLEVGLAEQYRKRIASVFRKAL